MTRTLNRESILNDLSEELRGILRDQRAANEKADRLLIGSLLDEWGFDENHAIARERARDKIRFNRTIENIPRRARFEALAGSRQATVYSFDEKEVNRPGILPPGSDRTFCTPDMLKSVAERVWMKCVERRLSPRIHWVEDCVTREGRWQINIHW